MLGGAENRSRTADAMLLGAGVPVGWYLYDVSVFVTAGDRSAVLELLPGSLALAAAGALLGLAWARFPRLVAGFALLVLLASFARQIGLAPPEATTAPARAVLLAGLGFVAAALAQRRFRVAALGLGLAAGVLCGVASQAVQDESLPPLRITLPVVAALAASGWVRRPAWRWALICLAIALPSVVAARRGANKHWLVRRDLPPPQAAVARGRPNVLLIVMDTVRADRLGAYGYQRATTPALDAFARDHATRFEEVRATSSWTLPSHASMFTGLLPGEHGADHPREKSEARTLDVAVRPAQMMRSDVPTLAERLRAEGYRTAAILANEAYLNHRFHLHRGFERYDDRKEGYVGEFRALVQLFGHRLRVGHIPFRRARTISDLAFEWLSSVKGERPFFLVLNYMDAHSPYFPPAPFDREFGPERPADPLRPEPAIWPLAYDRSLRYLDSEVGRLLEHLVAEGLFDGTAVIVTSDHGEAFGEHGYWSHAWELYEELLRVPLLVKPAGGRVKAVEPRPMSLADMHDLVLDLAGLRPTQAFGPRAVAAEWYHGEANNFVREWAGRVGRDIGIDLVAWVDVDRKYIVGSDGSVKAFDLPDERTPVPLTDAERERARARALDWWRSHPPRGREAVKPTEDELNRLRALGYVR